MQKIIKLSSEAPVPEFLIFEFQGEFEHTTLDDFDEQVLGSVLEKPGGNFELTCGNHLLKGTHDFIAKYQIRLTL